MQLTEIRVAGFGGQGVIMSAIVIGKAGCIYQNGFATMTQNFGPEARGGACSAQVILSDQSHSLPVRHAARHPGRDVAGGVYPVQPAD